MINHKKRITFFESFVFSELAYQSSFLTVGHVQIYYYRNLSDVGVDLVLSRRESGVGEESVVGITVKPSASAQWSDFKALRYFKTEMGPRCICGLVIYTGETTQHFGEKFFAIPVNMIWSFSKAKSKQEDAKNNDG